MARHAAPSRHRWSNLFTSSAPHTVRVYNPPPLRVHPDVISEARAIIGTRWCTDLSWLDEPVLQQERARTIQNIQTRRAVEGLPIWA